MKFRIKLSSKVFYLIPNSLNYFNKVDVKSYILIIKTTSNVLSIQNTFSPSKKRIGLSIKCDLVLSCTNFRKHIPRFHFFDPNYWNI